MGTYLIIHFTIYGCGKTDLRRPKQRGAKTEGKHLGPDHCLENQPPKKYRNSGHMASRGCTQLTSLRHERLLLCNEARMQRFTGPPLVASKEESPIWGFDRILTAKKKESPAQAIGPRQNPLRVPWSIEVRGLND